MEEEVAGGGGKMSKKVGEGEVDYKTKSGTAWSHNFLNQKPWHPLSYPNQRRKWIAEQTNAERARRQEEVAREFAQEQQFFRQTALFNEKEKEKMEMMKAVSFMYVRPPGFNPESAKAAEVADQDKSNNAASTSSKDPEPKPDPGQENKTQKTRRPKDIYGRAMPTENEFDILKNAPKLDTGIAGRSKPFAVEIRNVRCVRCGTFGHQSGDRECPMKDTIMPIDETRLKRDDPLNAIMAQTDSSEPLKWELKQKPGISPPRGGFNHDDPNQQILPDQDIFDEYGGFLRGGDIIPTLLSNFPTKKEREKSKRKKSKSSSSKRKPKRHKEKESSESESEDERKKERSKSKRRKEKRYSSSSSESSDSDEDDRRSKRRSKRRDDYSDHDRDRRKDERKHICSRTKAKDSADWDGSDRYDGHHHRRKH